MCWVIIVLLCHEKCTFLIICNIPSRLPSVQSINCKLLVINYLSKGYWLSIDYLFCEVFQRLMLLLEADVKEMNLFFLWLIRSIEAASRMKFQDERFRGGP